MNSSRYGERERERTMAREGEEEEDTRNEKEETIDWTWDVGRRSWNSGND